MTNFPNSRRLVKGGIVLIDPDTSAVQRIVALQYNPDSLGVCFSSWLGIARKYCE
jgi:hypothetical protein